MAGGPHALVHFPPFKVSLVGAQVFGKVSQPGCDLTWFLLWEPRRGHQTGLSGGTHGTWILPLTPTQKEQPLFAFQPQT